jgi:hypothetical protein
MPLNMTIEVTSGVAATEVPADVAADLAEAYAALAKLPVNRQVSVDFPVTDFQDLMSKDGKEVKVTAATQAASAARVFVKQGKAWAAAQTPMLTFARKGDIKGNPTRVSFRIYVPRPGDADTTGTPETPAESAK